MRAFIILSLLSLALSFSALAQSKVGVELDEITDNRVADGTLQGGCDVRVKLTGTGLDKAVAARVIVKEAQDDRGNALYHKPINDDFTPRDYNMGTLQFSLKQPARAASSVRIKGTVELFVPSRDPNAIVKIEKAKLDAPLSSKTLKAAKVDVTLLSPAGYAALKKSRKITDKDIEGIREEGRKRGVSDKEIEAMIGFAKAMEDLDGDLPPNAVIFSGKEADFDRVFRIEVLGRDGKPLETSGSSTSTRGDDTIMILQPKEAPPANPTLQVHLLTEKSRVSFPFEMNVPLP